MRNASFRGYKVANLPTFQFLRQACDCNEIFAVVVEDRVAISNQASYNLYTNFALGFRSMVNAAERGSKSGGYARVSNPLACTLSPLTLMMQFSICRNHS